MSSFIFVFTLMAVFAVDFASEADPVVVNEIVIKVSEDSAQVTCTIDHKQDNHKVLLAFLGMNETSYGTVITTDGYVLPHIRGCKHGLKKYEIEKIPNNKDVNGQRYIGHNRQYVEYDQYGRQIVNKIPASRVAYQLKINCPTREDIGLYKCYIPDGGKSRNTWSSQSGYLHLGCGSQPYIEDEIIPEYSENRKSAHLTCTVVNTKDNHSIIWSFLHMETGHPGKLITIDDVVHTDDPKCEKGIEKYEIQRRGSGNWRRFKLTVNCLNSTDLGYYKCYIPNGENPDVWPAGVGYLGLLTKTDKDDAMSWEVFLCYFKCLGGPATVGAGDVLALISLVYATIPAVGLTTSGIAADSISSILSAWSKGGVTAGSLVTILKTLEDTGIGLNSVLIALFGSAKVDAASHGGCECSM